MSSAIAKLLGAFSGAKIDYVPYSMDDVVIMYGIPPFKVGSVDYVFAQHANAEARLVMGLNAEGVFVNNKNKSGIIEFGLLNGSLSGGAIQVANMTGIPFPVAITDKSSKGTSTVLGSACRMIATPGWRRALFPGLTIYTLHTPRLLISQGVRLPAS